MMWKVPTGPEMSCRTPSAVRNANHHPNDRLERILVQNAAENGARLLRTKGAGKQQREERERARQATAG